jgi:guanylate kinase
VDYDYCSDAVFDELVRSGRLLEWAEIFGHRSGTPREPLEKALTSGRDVLMEVDVEGARSIKAQLPSAVAIFVAPPSLDDLAERLRQRRSEEPEAMRRRLAKAEEELESAAEFDHVVINDDFEKAWREIADIISAST